jgi:GT2 family glycosyltransferase
VSDDSPSDVLQSVVREFHDPRLSYRCNTPSRGPAANHWSCFREARGEFIVILNHDDVLEPVFLERLLPPLQNNPSIAVAFCDHWIIDDSGAVRRESSDEASRHYGRTTLAAGPHEPFHQQLLHQTIPMAMGAVFRRSALPADLPANAGPAYDLWLTAIG